MTVTTGTVSTGTARGDTPRRPILNHWMDKAAIMRAVVHGEPGTALCGATFTPSSTGGGVVYERGAIICPACQAVYNRMTD